MLKKEIYASVEIADHEIRLVVGEFYETRFNVLRVEKEKITGIENKKIVDEQNVINGIIKAVRQAEENLGYHIERVLLAMPGVNVTRFNRRAHVIPQISSKRVRLSDIQRGLNDVILYKPDPKLELVNIGCIKYITNGITSRKMPLDEVCDLMIMDVDLLYADKETVYAYARCVEKAGLEILDICLDSYAIAQEAAIFEQTVDKYVVLVDIAKYCTTLSLFSYGKLVNSAILENGFGDWINPLCEAYGFSFHVGYRLVQNTCTFIEDKARDSVIYVWSTKNEQKQLTEKDACSIVAPLVKTWIENVNEACEPIVANGKVRYILTGSGCEIRSLEQLLDGLNASWQIYVPQTIGARDSSLAACLGMFYSWKEQQSIRKDERISCDLRDVEQAMESVGKQVEAQEEGSITKRLKSILLNEK